MFENKHLHNLHCLIYRDETHMVSLVRVSNRPLTVELKLFLFQTASKQIQYLNCTEYGKVKIRHGL